MTIEEMAASVEFVKPEDAYRMIPTKQRETILNEICKLLVGRNLSFQQAELLLELAKRRLRKAKI